MKKKYYSLFFILLSVYGYTQLTNTQATFSQISNMRIDAMRVMSTYTTGEDYVKMKLKKINNKLDKFSEKLQKEEMKLVDFQNEESTTLETEKQIEKTKKRANKLKSRIAAQDNKRDRYKQAQLYLEEKKEKKINSTQKK